MRFREGNLLRNLLVLGFAITFSMEVVAQIPDCSMAKWDGAAPTVPGEAAGSPLSNPSVIRYSEFCGLEVSDTGWVQTPATSDGHYFGRFYVHTDVTGGTLVDLLVAYSDNGTTELFKISYDGANFVFDATAATGGGSGSAPAQAGKWNLVEFEFNSGFDFNVWVNETWSGTEYASTSIAPFASGAGTVVSVRLGAPNGMGGFTGALTYDAYEAHRTTNVGALMDCDAQGDADIDINDALAIVDEAFGNPTVLAAGQPDCDLNGSVNINDVLEIVDIVFP